MNLVNMVWLYGEIEKNNISLEFIKIDDREFVEFEINVQSFISEEDLIEYINELNLNENDYYKVILCGNRNFEIDTKNILKMTSLPNILKIKNNTKINYNIEELAKENNLKGFFVRNILNAYESGLYTEEEINKALEIGLGVM